MLSELEPGDRLLRREVHARFAGRRQGGIAPSSRVPVVMFFTDPAKGHKHGYYDGVDQRGYLNYVGEGQRGDQKLDQGNGAILHHRRQGRSLEGFRSRGTEVEYLGEFELVDHYFREAHDTTGEALRQVVVFRLRPLVELQDFPTVPITRMVEQSRVILSPVERQFAEVLESAVAGGVREARRREATLVCEYAKHLADEGHTVGRLQLIPAGEVDALWCDLWDHTARDLVEAKGAVTRENLRMAVGQLCDYGRFVDAETRTVLLPSKPRPDLLAFLASVGIDAVCRDGGGWTRYRADDFDGVAEKPVVPTLVDLAR